MITIICTDWALIFQYIFILRTNVITGLWWSMKPSLWGTCSESLPRPDTPLGVIGGRVVVWRPARGWRRRQIAASVRSNGMAWRGVTAFLLGGGTTQLLQPAHSVERKKYLKHSHCLHHDYHHHHPASYTDTDNTDDTYAKVDSRRYTAEAGRDGADTSTSSK